MSSMKKVLSYSLASILILGSAACGYFAYTFAQNKTNKYELWFLAGLLIVAALVTGLSLLIETARKRTNGADLMISLILIAALTCSSLYYAKIYQLPDQETVPNFYGQTLVEAQNWANEKQVSMSISYENSDSISKYSVMAQSVASGTLLSEVKDLSIVVSSGPNYDKVIVVPNMLGWDLDDVTAYIKTNYLTNVTIDFTDSTETLYSVISQDKYGELSRKEPIKIVVAYKVSELKAQTMVDMTGYSQFEAELWFKKYGIPYTLSTEFSDEIERGTVISVSAETGTQVSQTDNVSLVISKGKKIVVENIENMTVEEITSWVIENNLNIQFSEKYDDTITLGNIISVNVKDGDELEEESVISLVISKGPIVMKKFATLGEFKVWASTYGVPYSISYAFSDTVSSGQPIEYSYNEGQKIANGATITVTVSKGKAITMPDLRGWSKSDIKSKCSSLGLYCYFQSGSYRSDYGTDVAYKQSIASGSTIEEGTSVTFTLSLGNPQTFTVGFSSGLLGKSYDETVSILTNYFATNYPGVNFNFIAKASNSLASGQIHPDSETKFGSSVTQGQTYNITIVK